MSESRQIAMPAEQAEALAAILAVTRREWEAAGQCRKGDKADADADRRGGARNRRASALTQLAARAFEAQVMALRCRQAFVG